MNRYIFTKRASALRELIGALFSALGALLLIVGAVALLLAYFDVLTH
jgi:hypothetical protein